MNSYRNSELVIWLISLFKNFKLEKRILWKFAKNKWLWGNWRFLYSLPDIDKLILVEVYVRGPILRRENLVTVAEL